VVSYQSGYRGEINPRARSAEMEKGGVQELRIVRSLGRVTDQTVRGSGVKVLRMMGSMKEFARVYECVIVVLPPRVTTWTAGINLGQYRQIDTVLRGLRLGSLCKLRVGAQSDPPGEHWIRLGQGGERLRRENPPRVLIIYVGLYKVWVRRCVPHGRRRRCWMRVVDLVWDVRTRRHKGRAQSIRGGRNVEVVVDFLDGRGGYRRGVVGFVDASV
jgi:hypothetical protein